MGKLIEKISALPPFQIFLTIVVLAFAVASVVFMIMFVVEIYKKDNKEEKTEDKGLFDDKKVSSEKSIFDEEPDEKSNEDKPRSVSVSEMLANLDEISKQDEQEYSEEQPAEEEKAEETPAEEAPVETAEEQETETPAEETTEEPAVENAEETTEEPATEEPVEEEKTEETPAEETPVETVEEQETETPAEETTEEPAVENTEEPAEGTTEEPATEESVEEEKTEETPAEEAPVETVEEQETETPAEETTEEPAVENVEEPTEETTEEPATEEPVEEPANGSEDQALLSAANAEYQNRLDSVIQNRENIRKDIAKYQKDILKYERTERRRERNQKMLDRRAGELTNLNLVMYSVTDIKNVDEDKKKKQVELTSHIAELKASIQDADEYLDSNRDKNAHNISMVDYLQKEESRYNEEIEQLESLIKSTSNPDGENE